MGSDSGELRVPAAVTTLRARVFERVSVLLGAERHAPLRRAVRWGLVALMVAFILAGLSHIGWRDVWRARPTQPLFYLLVLAGYLVLPLADTLIYRRLWGIRFWSSLPVFLRKRIYNSALIGYSGEVMLLLWAKHKVALRDTALAHAIKDSNILSAVVSTYVSAALILYVVTDAALKPLLAGSFVWWALGTLALAAAAPFGFLFRKRFMALGREDAMAVLALHAGRFLLGQLLTLMQWLVVLPQVGLDRLMVLLAVQLLISRLPMVPSRDLLFIGTGMALAHSLSVPQAALASLLVVTNVLQQLMHLAVLALCPSPRSGPGAGEAAP